MSDRTQRWKVSFATAALVAIAVLACLCGASAQTAAPGQRVNVVFTTLTPYGFDPAKLNVAAGRAVVVVYNRTGLRQVSLRVGRETGKPDQPIEVLKDVRLPGTQRRWNDLMALTPGQYSLTEANHPKWVCQVVVGPAGN